MGLGGGGGEGMKEVLWTVWEVQTTTYSGLPGYLGADRMSELAPIQAHLQRSHYGFSFLFERSVWMYLGCCVANATILALHRVAFSSAEGLRYQTSFGVGGQM